MTASHSLGSRRPYVGAAWMALASILFALMNIGVRVASRRVPWSEVAVARMAVGAFVAVMVARARGASLRVHEPRSAWARSFFGTLGMLTGFYALAARDVPVADAATLFATSPIFIALLSPSLLGERSGGAAKVATFVAFCGVALIAGPELRIAGVVAASSLGSALFSAMAMIWLRRLGRGRSGAPPDAPEAIVVHFSLVACAAALVVAGRDLRLPSSGDLAILAATGAAGGLAQVCMTHAYRFDHAARLGAVGYLQVVLVHALGVAFLGEATSSWGALGAALVIAAGVAVTTTSARAAAEVPAPPARG